MHGSQAAEAVALYHKGVEFREQQRMPSMMATIQPPVVIERPDLAGMRMLQVMRAYDNNIM